MYFDLTPGPSPRDFFEQMQSLAESMMAQTAGPAAESAEIQLRETPAELSVVWELPVSDKSRLAVDAAEEALSVQATLKDGRSFHQALRLPVRVDPEKAKAAFNEGLLRVTLPKRQAVVRRLELK